MDESKSTGKFRLRLQEQIEDGRVKWKNSTVQFLQSITFKVAIHLGPNYFTNSEICKSTKFEKIQSSFKLIQKLIMEHSEEILNVKFLESSSPSWTRSVLSHGQAIKWAKAKVCVYADSFL